MVGMVLLAGQTAIPGGWIGARGSDVTLVLIVATLPLSAAARSEIGPIAARAEVEVVLAEAFVEEAEAAAHGHLAVAEHVVREADAGLTNSFGRRESAGRAGAGIANQPQRGQHCHRIADDETVAQIDGRARWRRCTC